MPLKKTAFDSDDDSSGSDVAAHDGTKGTMKSIFAADRATSQPNMAALKYEPPKRDKVAEAAATVVQGTGPAQPGSAAPPGQGGTAAAATASVIAYRGDQHVGPAAMVVAVNSGQANVIVIDREKRPLCKVHVDEAMQMLPSFDDARYATLYDPIGQIHWSFMFRSVEECHGFVAAAITVQHYLLLPEGPRAPVVDLVEGPKDEFERPTPAKQGSTVMMSLLVWKLKRVGQTYTTDKLIDTIPMDAPRKIEVGRNDQMIGVEEALVGARPGTWRLVMVSPKKTRTDGLGNPEIGPKDSVVAFVRLHSIVDAEEDTRPLAIEDKRGASTAAGPRSALADVASPNPHAPPQASPAPQVAPAKSEEDNLFKALLLQTMQMQQQQAAHFQSLAHHQPQPPAPPPAPVRPQPDEATIPAHVERSLDRINQQLSSLYEKIDRLDFEKRLDQNNEKIERMVKKAVGKMPVNDVDIEDMAKDKDQLLARIEALKQKLEEMTDNYHTALSQCGESKERLAAAANDLAIERSSSEKALIDLKERHRLQIVEAEVRLRNAVDQAREQAFEEGREQGYERGYQNGKIDAMTGENANESVVKLREMLSAREQEIVVLQSRIGELERRGYEDRRMGTDEKAALQGLIERLEAKERQRQGVVYDQATAMSKLIRRVMNATYASFEEQVYAAESQSIPVQDALNMALVAVKTEARNATEELKREAASRSAEPAYAAADNEAERRRTADDADRGLSKLDGASSGPSPNSSVGGDRRSRGIAGHYDPTASSDSASPTARVQYGTGVTTFSGTTYEGVEEEYTSAAVAAAVKYVPASRVQADEVLNPEVAEMLEEARRGQRSDAEIYDTALASAYAMPTNGVAHAPGGDAGLADEDEIAAYLSSRGAAGDEEVHDDE
jgi:flagellar biosynthesis/type III secretory pathway protein FliH